MSEDCLKQLLELEIIMLRKYSVPPSLNEKNFVIRLFKQASIDVLQDSDQKSYLFNHLVKKISSRKLGSETTAWLN